MYDVMATLRRYGEPYQLTAGELVRQAMVTTGAITNRIDRLAERGPGRARSAADRRKVIVRLTAAGPSWSTRSSRPTWRSRRRSSPPCPPAATTWSASSAPPSSPWATPTQADRPEAPDGSFPPRPGRSPSGVTPARPNRAQPRAPQAPGAEPGSERPRQPATPGTSPPAPARPRRPPTTRAIDPDGVRARVPTADPGPTSPRRTGRSTPARPQGPSGAQPSSAAAGLSLQPPTATRPSRRRARLTSPRGRPRTERRPPG